MDTFVCNTHTPLLPNLRWLVKIQELLVYLFKNRNLAQEEGLITTSNNLSYVGSLLYIFKI